MMKKVSKEEIIKIIKYLFSSGSSFFIDLLLFTIFKVFLKDILSINSCILLATIMARIISSYYNYLVNSRFVFKSKAKNAIIKYYILVVIQMLISAFSVMIINSIANINTTIIKFFIDIIIFIANYIIQRFIIFNR